MQNTIHGSLTVTSANLCIRLGDIGSKFADVFCREATIASSATADTLIYYPSGHSSDLIRNNFVDLWGCRTCYFDPYVAVTCPKAIRRANGRQGQ